MKRLDLDDKSSMNVKNDSDLSRNYAALRNTSSFTQCTIASYRRCEVINQCEVSRALNHYAEKMSATARIGDAKLLKICQEIKKLNGTAEMKKNDELKTSHSTSDDIASFEKNTVQTTAIDAFFTEEKFIEPSLNLQKISTNCDVTVDDFLTMSNENLFQTTGKEIALIQDGLDEAIQKDFSTLQHIALEQTELLKKSKKEIQEIKDQDQAIVYPPHSSTERPYVCSKCQKTFKRNLHLRRHFIVAHTQSKNFKCDICEKSFSRKDYLDKHVAGHQKKDLKIKLLEQGIVVRTKLFSKTVNAK